MSFKRINPEPFAFNIPLGDGKYLVCKTVPFNFPVSLDIFLLLETLFRLGQL